MKEEFVIIKQKDLSNKYLDEIIRLKEQHWKYSYESQKQWIMSKLMQDDIHLLLKVDNKCVAYLSINDIRIVIDGQEMNAKGLGNVCVDCAYRKKGYGIKIVKKADDIIMQTGSLGVLLCHSQLIPFYGICGWTSLVYNSMSVENSVFSDGVMLFNSKIKRVFTMVIDRNF